MSTPVTPPMPTAPPPPSGVIKTVRAHFREGDSTRPDITGTDEYTQHMTLSLHKDLTLLVHLMLTATQAGSVMVAAEIDQIYQSYLAEYKFVTGTDWNAP